MKQVDLYNSEKFLLRLPCYIFILFKQFNPNNKVFLIDSRKGFAKKLLYLNGK